MDDRAPDFTLSGLDGLDYALHEGLGKGPVLLAFWQTECPACALAAPYFNRLYDAYENLTWSFWAICQEGAAAAAGFVRRHDFRPTVLVDAPALAVSRAYDPPSTPTLYLVEPPGRVMVASAGFVKDELNAISRRIAEYAGAEYVEVAPADDGAPAFKPG
ncbi:MAG: TlpA family protein disulfide reductase [Dehalococcoidia bacterium]|nr:TlpA family protein disulfide reductase [Dehalococcoidia bacterium]